jgi:hypothetical protein
MIYYKGCTENPHPDIGWVVEHRQGSVYCAAEETDVDDEEYYVVHWCDGSNFHSTHAELEQEEFQIMEKPCN